MKSSKIAALFASLVAFSTVAPAFAGDDGVDKAVNSSLVLTRIGGVGAGLLVGTPVSVVRQTCRSYKGLTESAADKVGGKDFGPSCLLVSVVTLPASLIVGGAKGTYMGSRAAAHGFNDPFNAQSFSVGKLEE